MGNALISRRYLIVYLQSVIWIVKTVACLITILAVVSVNLVGLVRIVQVIQQQSSGYSSYVVVHLKRKAAKKLVYLKRLKHH